MKTELEKMLAGEPYQPLDPDPVARRQRARQLCQALNTGAEADTDERRRLAQSLFGRGGDSVWLQPPFFCDYGANIELGERVSPATCRTACSRPATRAGWCAY